MFGPSESASTEESFCSLLTTTDALEASVPCLWEEEKTPTTFVNLVSSRGEEILHQRIANFWVQEECGIAPERELAPSPEDLRALKRMEEETKLVNNRYTVPMLWADPNRKFRKNLPMVLRRFEGTKKRLAGNPDL